MDEQITPPEYERFPETLPAGLIASAGASLSSPPMCMTVPPALPAPVVFTQETVRVYYARIKETAMYYDLRMPYLGEFIRKCSGPVMYSGEPIKEFLEDVYFSNEFDWANYDAMALKVTKLMPTNSKLCIDRLRELFKAVLSPYLASGYSTTLYGRSPYINDNFAHDFERILDLLEQEASTNRTTTASSTLKSLRVTLEAVYITAYEQHVQQKPTTVGFLEFHSDSSDDLAQFTEYKAFLLSKITLFQALSNGNWPFEKPVPERKSSGSKNWF